MSMVKLTFDEPEPHSVGQAVCMNCKHTWEARVPVEELGANVFFECEACLTRKAVFRNPYAASIGESFWQCDCGCEYFYMTKAYTACANCGAHQSLS